MQNGAFPVISWFINHISIDISTTNHSEMEVMFTNLQLGGIILCTYIPWSFLSSIDWFWREKLQERPMIFMGKSGWFTVSRFSLQLIHWYKSHYPIIPLSSYHHIEPILFQYHPHSYKNLQNNIVSSYYYSNIIIFQ